MLKDKTGFGLVIDALSSRSLERKIDLVLGIEARGFIFGPALAYRPQCRIRACSQATQVEGPSGPRHIYDLDDGSDTLEIHMDAIQPRGQSVVLVDDLLATGGTMEATVKLVKQLQAERIAGLAFAVELDFPERP